MHDSSIFNIRIDFEKSRNSYIYDKNTKQHFLDFFGLYATLPLGYNHEIFRCQEFREEYMRIAAIKVPNCEMISDEAQEFLKAFSGHEAMAGFQHFHFCCTGALAIEAAIKIAIDQKGSAKPMVISFKESFHGINSYGGFVTDRFHPVSTRLDGFPEIGWVKIHNPKIIYRDNTVDEDATKKGLKRFHEEFERCLSKYGKENIAALVVEPIQATYGDNYFTQEFFTTIRQLCSEHNIALIFDEIQTGLGTTGKMWYSQYLGIVPDIVAFGKKCQVSGVMVKERWAKTFQSPVRLEVTWDGHLADMIRCKYILRAYRKYNILENVALRSRQLVEGLKEIPQLKNLRFCGLFVAFDFDTEEQRNEFFKKAVERRFLCNKTRDKTIRLRPSLNISAQEIDNAFAIIKESNAIYV